MDKYLKKDKKDNKIDNGKDNENSEEEHLKENIEEEKIEIEEKFTCIQKISLIIFIFGFIALILGVLLLKWSIIFLKVVSIENSSSFYFSYFV